MIKVSVCLTVWERGNVVPKTIESILNQSYDNFELIINDDHSLDNTKEVCLYYQKNDRRVKYYQNETRLFMPGNLNAAIQKAQGEYIANLHDGDQFHPDLLRLWVNMLDKYPSAGMVFNAYESLDKEGNHRCFYFHDFPELIPGKTLVSNMLHRWDSPIRGTVMARWKCYEKLGLFDPKFGHISDVDMWMRIANQFDVAYVREPLIITSFREKYHPYNMLIWEETTTLYKIHHINITRHYKNSLLKTKLELTKLRIKRISLYLKVLLSQIKHKNADFYDKGLLVFRTSDSPLLVFIGYLGLYFSETNILKRKK